MVFEYIPSCNKYAIYAKTSFDPKSDFSRKGEKESLESETLCKTSSAFNSQCLVLSSSGQIEVTK